MTAHHVAAHRVTVKICGLVRPGDAAVAEAAGAAYLGTILAGGPRLVTLEQAAAVLGPRRAGIQRAAVFGQQSEAEIVHAAQVLDLDIVQLHHGPSVERIARLQRETACVVWPVARISGSVLPAEVDDWTAAAGALVMDALVVGQLGGTGVALDWSALAEAVGAWRERHPSATLVLAGGLNPRNVAAAVQLLSPTVVDVSSGVERAPGEKDATLVHHFVQAAHGAVETAP